ncbi:hypothetical protein OC834_007337 [Tilletia horrida]|nr:hypothetical protein OC834_007337 [Tilletia horrida]
MASARSAEFALLALDTVFDDSPNSDRIISPLQLIDSLGKGKGANIRDSLPRPPHGRNGTEISSDTRLSAAAKQAEEQRVQQQKLESNAKTMSMNGITSSKLNRSESSDAHRPRPSPDRLREKMAVSESGASSGTRKRKSNHHGDESDTERPSGHSSKKAKSSGASSGSASSSSLSTKMRSVSRTPSEESADSLPPKPWTLDLLSETSRKYKARGRQLKHAGDKQMREYSADQQDGASKARLTKQEVIETAALQHIDAILHYVYAFWCDDQVRALNSRKADSGEGGGQQTGGAASSSGNGSSPVTLTATATQCVPSNWTTLFPFLEFSIKFVQRTGWTHLIGLCKLVEAMVRHLLLAHEQRLLNARMAKLNSQAQATLIPSASAGMGSGTGEGMDEDLMEDAPPTPGGPPDSQVGNESIGSEASARLNGSQRSKHGSGGSGGSASEGAAKAAASAAAAAAAAHLKELGEVTESMARLTRDSERVSALFTEARSALSYTVLREHFPLTWAACIASDLDSPRSAPNVEPDESVGFGSEGRISLARFAWPIEYNSGVTHVVCFGRALVAELARSRKSIYVPAPVMAAAVESATTAS